MKKLIFTVTILCLTVAVQSQKKSGSLEPLKGQTSLIVEFDYSGATYDDQIEAAFFTNETKELSEADAAAWKANWQTTAKSSFLQTFINEYNKDCEYIKIVSGESKYKLLVAFKEIDLGAYAGPFSKPAWLTGTFKFVEVTTGIEVATIPFKKVMGNPYAVIGQPTQEARIKDACSALGEKAVDEFCKQLK